MSLFVVYNIITILLFQRKAGIGMRIEQLQYFADIALTHSISQTANHFYTTHQSVSLSVKKLENEIGTELLNRTKTGVTLTLEGERFLEYVLDILKTYDKISRDFPMAKSSPTPSLHGHLIVYAPSRILDTFLAPTIDEFLKHNPTMQLSLKTLPAIEILEQLSIQPISLGILALHNYTLASADFQHKLKALHLHFEIISSEELYVVLNKSSKWKELSFSHITPEQSDFTEIPLVGFEYGFNHPSKTRFSQIATYQVNTIAAQHKFITEKYGIGLITMREYEQFFAKDKNLILKPYENYPPLHFGYIIPSFLRDTPIIAAFTALLSQNLK